METIVGDFKDLEAFLSFIAAPASSLDQLRRNRDNESFTGASFDQAVHIARHGWELAKISLETDRIKRVSGYTTDIVHDVRGAVVDMGAFVMGVPENMIDFQLVEAAKFLDLFLDVSTPSFETVAGMLNRGMAMALLVDELERSGTRVRVSAISGGTMKTSNDFKYACRVLIKDFNQPMDIGQISGVCHPSFNRQLKFAWIENAFQGLRDGMYLVDNSYGTSSESVDELRDYFTRFIEHDVPVFVVPGLLLGGGAFGITKRTKKRVVTSNGLSGMGPYCCSSIDGAKKYIQHFIDNPIL